MSFEAGETWVVILAGGPGNRMSVLTALVHDHPVPKQFACLIGDRSHATPRTSIQQTIDRLCDRVAPSDRLLVLVADAHEKYVRAQLSDWPTLVVLSQPSDKGTAAAVAHALAYIRARATDANVLVVPSDQHVENDDGFAAAAVEALKVAADDLGSVTLLGAPPTNSDADLGWVLPELDDHSGEPCPAGARWVRRVYEHAPSDFIGVLSSRGALWNTQIVAGRVAALWGMCKEKCPVLTARFEALHAAPFDHDALASVYGDIPSGDFMRDVVVPSAKLMVVATGRIGWADWGTPERFLTSVRGTPAFAAFLARIDEAFHTHGNRDSLVGAA